jgi:hypothetical protein
MDAMGQMFRHSATVLIGLSHQKSDNRKGGETHGEIHRERFRSFFPIEES